MAYMNFQGPGFTLEIPTDWYITSSPQFQAIFLGTSTTEGVRPNLSIAIRPVEADVTPEAVAAESLRIQQAQYSEYEVLEEIDFSEQGGSGFWRRYQWLNDSHNMKIVQIQVFLVNDSLLHTLTATTTQTYYDEIQATLVHMLTSFRFVN